MKRLLNRLRQPVFARTGAAAALPFWRRVRWTLQRLLRRLGWPGMLAIGILAICTASYFSVIRPTQERLGTVQQHLASLRKQLVLAGTQNHDIVLTPEAQLAVFYRKFPEEQYSPVWLEKLVALAANRGLSLNDGEYKVTRDKVGKLVRYQMILPVQGEYPQIRKFLADLPGALPVVALENVQFERPKIADPNVEAKIKLILYLEQAS